MTFFLRKNPALRILLIGSMLVHIATAMLGPIYALFVDKVGGSLLDASFAGTVYAVTAGVMILFFGNISDNVKHPKYIVVSGYITVGIGFLLYTQVSTIAQLIAVQIITGVGEALYSPAFDKLYSEHLDKGKGGAEWGFWEAMYYFAVASGAFLGGITVFHYGFNALFIIMTVLCFASALYILRTAKYVLN